VRDGLADHWAEMVGLEVRQVNEGQEVHAPSLRRVGANEGLHPHLSPLRQ
jgi:hypothetical protein